MGFGVWGFGLGVWGLGCVDSVRAVGAPFTLGIVAHPRIARLRQHVVSQEREARFPTSNPPLAPCKGRSKCTHLLAGEVR